MFTYVYQGLTGIHRDYTGILIYYFFVYWRVHLILRKPQPPPRPCLYTGIHKLSTGNPQATNVGMVLAQDSTGQACVYSRIPIAPPYHCTHTQVDTGLSLWYLHAHT